MTVIRGPEAFHSIAAGLLQAIETELEVTGGGPVDRACVVPGGIVWDDCNCGMLALSLSRIWLTDTFPEESSVSPCPGAFFAATITAEVARCTPVPDEAGEPPTCTALEQSAAQVSRDAWTLINTVDCYLGTLDEDDRIVAYLLRPLQTVGPLGDCAGSSVSATIAINRGRNTA